MVLNPLAFATPQQREQLARMQELSKRIRYIVHTDDAQNRIQITLKADDPESTQLIPQILEAMVGSTTQMLYQLFAMEGERI